jgi:membrane-associated protease RseP (regulator of RpoE activity)
LGPFLAAFVEPDEKEMSKRPAKNQMAILAGGSFANLIMAILFFLLLGCFFVSAYAPTGVSFNMYTMKNVNLSDISEINGKSVNLTDYPSFVNAVKETNTSELTLTSGEDTYITTNDTIFLQEKILENSKGVLARKMLLLNAANSLLDSEKIRADVKAMNEMNENLGKTVAFYTDTPAYRAKLDGAILSIENKSTTSLDELGEALSQFKPGQNVTIKTTSGNYSIVLAENPENSSKAYIGIGFAQTSTSRLVEWFTSFSLFKKKAQFVYYAPKYDAFYGDLTIFIYNLLLWVLLINVSVMFVNMLPLGIFDGGKFFYLTVLAITKSKRKAMKGFKIAGSIILFILLLLMVIWFFKAF